MGAARTYTTFSLEAVGFGLLMFLLVADEVIDLPHLLLGAPRTPIRISELVIEVGATLVMGVGVIVASWRVNRRIACMESLILICGACRRVSADGRWMAFEEYIERRNDRRTTHGVCPACCERMMGALDEGAQELTQP
jgi:hypothetical protein